MRTLGLALALLIAIGCASAPAGTPVGCPLALVEGTLKGMPPDKLVLHTDTDELLEIRWSADLAVRPGSPPELIDSAGGVVARAGDRVEIVGASWEAGTWTECGGVRIRARAS